MSSVFEILRSQMALTYSRVKCVSLYLFTSLNIYGKVSMNFSVRIKRNHNNGNIRTKREDEHTKKKNKNEFFLHKDGHFWGRGKKEARTKLFGVEKQERLISYSNDFYPHLIHISHPLPSIDSYIFPFNELSTFPRTFFFAIFSNFLSCFRDTQVAI